MSAISPSLITLETQLLRLAPKIAQEAMRWYHTPLAVEQKRDKSLVSQADRSIELFVRDLLKTMTPDFGFVGEEFGRICKLSDHSSENMIEVQKNGQSLSLDVLTQPSLNIDIDTHWLLDPIDGTINFLTHVPLWSTLLALIVKGQPVLGFVLFPALGEVFIASIESSARYGSIEMCCSEDGLKPCFVASHVPLEDAHLSCTSPMTFGHRGLLGWYQSLLDRPAEFRTHSDAFGYSRVLKGSVHGMIDCMAAPYDLAALQVLFERTPGAHFLSLHGLNDGRRFRRGGAIGVCSRDLGEEILRDLRMWSSTAPMAFKKEKSPLIVTPGQLSILLERGVQIFLGEHPSVAVEDLSLTWESAQVFELEACNGLARVPPESELTQGLRCRAVINGCTGIASMVWDSKLQESDTVALVGKALYAALQSSKLLKSPKMSVLASRDLAIGHFGAHFSEIHKAKTFFGYGQALEYSQKPLPGLYEDNIHSIDVWVAQKSISCSQVFLDGAQQSFCRVESTWSITAHGQKDSEKRQYTQRGYAPQQLTQEEWARTLLQYKEKACTEVCELLRSPYVPETISYDYVIIDADLLGLILHEAVGHAAEGDLIQTNCSGFGQGSSVAPIQVAPPWMNIVVDGSLNTCGQTLVDAEGVVSSRKVIVDKGIFKHPIHSRETAYALGGIPEGSARSQTVLDPSMARMTNIWIQIQDPHRHDLPEDFSYDNPRAICELLKEKSYLTQGKKILYLTGWRGGTASCSNLEFRVDVQKVYLMTCDADPTLMHHANFTGSAIGCLQAAVTAFGPTICKTYGICGKDGQLVPTSDGGPSLLLLKKSNAIQICGLGEETDVS